MILLLSQLRHVISLSHHCHGAPRRVFTTTRRALQATNPLQLRAYQEDAINAVLKDIKNGKKRLGLSLATGSGKTVIFTHLIDRITPPNDKATQTMILAHRRELVEQAASHCSRTYPDKIVDIELGNLKATGTADITVASVKSITSQDRINNFDPSRFKLILVDEAHHIVAKSYLNVLSHFGLRHLQPDSPILVGVSATFSRFDGLKLGSVIDHITYHRDYVDMIDQGWLSDVLFTTVLFKDADLRKVKLTGNGDFATGSLSSVINTLPNNQALFDAWSERCSDRRSTVVFCVNIAHIESLTTMFRENGIDARFVTGKTPSSERSKTVDAFKNGEFAVLLNCGVFTEGTDMPNIDCIVLGRPTKSRNMLVQMIGRGMRLSNGKKNCHIIDMVTALKTGIVTTPTLFGLDPDELVREAKVKDLETLKTAKYNKQADVIQDEDSPELKFIDYNSVTELIASSKGDRHIRQYSRLSWVQIKPNDYILSHPQQGHLRLSLTSHANSLPSWTASFVGKFVTANRSGFARKRVIFDISPTFEDAVHAADTWAMENLTPTILIEWAASWRRSDATESQINYLNKFRDQDDQLEMGEITKGRAADMIPKIRYGGIGQFRKSQRVKKKKEKILFNETVQRAKEVVKEGPLDPSKDVF
jgi:ATP-dependent helicase IRC3